MGFLSENWYAIGGVSSNKNNVAKFIGGSAGSLNSATPSDKKKYGWEFPLIKLKIDLELYFKTKLIQSELIYRYK